MRQMIELKIKTEPIPNCVTIRPDEMAGLPRRQIGVVRPRCERSRIRRRTIGRQGQMAVPSIGIRYREHERNVQLRLKREWPPNRPVQDQSSYQRERYTQGYPSAG